MFGINSDYQYQMCSSVKKIQKNKNKKTLCICSLLGIDPRLTAHQVATVPYSPLGKKLLNDMYIRLLGKNKNFNGRVFFVFFSNFYIQFLYLSTVKVFILQPFFV